MLSSHKSTALRVLAVTTEQRLPDLPDVPTIAELGYSGYEISSWQGVFAPAGIGAELRVRREELPLQLFDFFASPRHRSNSK